jgi:hypothetical protein
MVLCQFNLLIFYSGDRKTCPLSLQPGHHNKIEGESSGETKSAPKKKTPVKRKQSKSQVAVKKEKVAKMSENEPAAVASTSELCKKGDPIPVDTESESELKFSLQTQLTYFQQSY